MTRCIFGTEDIPVLGCFVRRTGVRADPEKLSQLDQRIRVSSTCASGWVSPTSCTSPKGIRREDTSARVVVEKDVTWSWTVEH